MSDTPDQHPAGVTPAAAATPAPADPTPPPRTERQVLAALFVVALFVGLIAYFRASVPTLALITFGLGSLIFIHELGHFLAAKWCDVHVETFSIGFGPALPGCAWKWGETTYMLAMLPLGGYVKMVGEGSDAEEGEDDPRSFKNKSVGQRMVIISAGVIMNIILAAAIFVGVLMTSGVEKINAFVGNTDAGSPAWQRGIPSGARLLQIGKVANPTYDDLMPAAALSDAGQAIAMVYEPPGRPGERVEIALEPRIDPDGVGRPQVGIGPPISTLLADTKKEKKPATEGAAADAAEPPLQPRSRIVATTDPAWAGTLRLLRDVKPAAGVGRAAVVAVETVLVSQTTPLPETPADPHATGGPPTDAFAFHRRMVDLAGVPVAVVQRDTAGARTTSYVPPAFGADLGLVMRMGPIKAVRDNSPAATAGISAKAGDLLKGVEAVDGEGRVTRWLADPKPDATADVRPLDPILLPRALEAWVHAAPKPHKFQVTLLRADGHNDRATVAVPIGWTDGSRYESVRSDNPNSPQAVGGFGLAYAVEAVVEEARPNGAAAAAGVKRGDLVKAFRLSELSEGKEKLGNDWIEISPSQWAYAATLYQHPRFAARRLDLRVEREKETIDVQLAPPASVALPQTARGFMFETETHVVKAATPLEAVSLGTQMTLDNIGTVLRSLKSMVTGRVNFKKNAIGPLSIAANAYGVADRRVADFLLLVAVLSVNLAVVNFLPIPVLDGGHMVFLVYEKVAGRPPSESIRGAASIVGLVLIVGLMLYVLFLDARRLLA